MAHLEIVPAYGRDYKSQKAVREDWNANKDFTIVEASGVEGAGYGMKVNKADAEKVPGAIIARYDRLTKLMTLRN